MNSTIKEFARSAASLGVLQIGGMALTLVVGILLARQLGPSAYGVYALAMATVTFIGMLTEFGLPLLAMKEFGSATAHNGWGEARGLIRWADRIILSISALIVGGFLVFAWAGGFAARSTFLATLMWAAMLVPIVAIAKLRGLALLSMGHTFAGQFALLVMRPALFALALAVIWVADKELQPAEAMAWQVVAAGVALITVLSLFLHYRPREYRLANPVSRWKNWLATTVPMGMTEGLRLLQGQTAILMLGLLGTTEQVGLYRVADAAYLICLVPASIFNVVACPHFARLHRANERADLQALISSVTLAVLISICAVSAILFPFGERIITLAFGQDFAESYYALSVLLGGWLVVSLFGPAISLCNMIGRERDVVIGSIIALTGQIVIAIILIPRWGIVGAAVGLVVGQMLLFAFLAVRLIRTEGYNTTVKAINRKFLERLRAGNAIKNFLQRRN